VKRAGTTRHHIHHHINRLELLRDTRDRVWRNCTKEAVSRRNIHLTIRDFIDLDVMLTKWCVDFTNYVKTKPQDPNISKIAEQMTEKWQSYYLMRSRGEYLVEHEGGLQQEVKCSKERTLAELRKAESMLTGLGIGDVRNIL
jgi:hypothetical protein